MIEAITLALLVQTAPLSVTQTATDEPPSDLERECLEKHGADDEAAIAECLGIVDPLTAPLTQVEAGIAQMHPVHFYMFAGRLFGETDRQKDALFWFYAGQLRWRALMACDPPEPGEEGALFGAMQAMIGAQINQYAAQDVDLWVATIDRVLDWDDANRDPMLPSGCEAARAEQRKGLKELSMYIRKQDEAGQN